MEKTYLDDLNPQQRAAVEYLDGPQLVIAGAGSGKTRVLTYKIVHLLHNGYDPYRILALTFTNKAAREMRERISAVVGEHTAARLWMGTFHSIFSRILRRNAELIGFSKNYTIYDTSDSKSLIKMIVKDMELDEKIYKASTVQNNISWAKNQLISPEAYAADRELMNSDRLARRPCMADIYRAYMSRCRVSDAMDFDDLLFYMAVLLRDNPGVLRHYREFFQYVLVDEYQDTNFAQNYIMTMLTQGIGNVSVVGDDAQSIYSFRGANIRNILDLNRSYGNLRTFKLEQNYRSTQNIINAANSLIDKNEEQIRKKVYSLNDAGDRVEVQQGQSDYDEAGLVAAKITIRRSLSSEPYSEFAILYRTNAQSRVLEEALRRRNIPYKIYGGLAFYQRKEVKDALSYFRMAVNPNDDEALKRIINVPARGIGQTTLGKLSEAAIRRGVSIWDVLCDVKKHDININSGTARKLADFETLIKSFIERNENGEDAEKLAGHIVAHTGLLSQYLHDSTPENVSKVENIREIVTATHSFVEDQCEAGEENATGMADFLATVSLQTDQDTEDPALADSVTLMTIHAAKGLEFSNIFVVGVEEDLLPSSMSQDSRSEVEEERRLFYVAITRAKKYCMLTYAATRFTRGETVQCRPSRFLRDIDPKYLKYSYGSGAESFEPTVTRRTYGVPNYRPLNTADTQTSKPTLEGERIFQGSELKEGMRVMHAKFGKGVIQSIEDSDVGTSALVRFDNEPNVRKMLLKFAKFKLLD